MRLNPRDFLADKNKIIRPLPHLDSLSNGNRPGYRVWVSLDLHCCYTGGEKFPDGLPWTIRRYADMGRFPSLLDFHRIEKGSVADKMASPTLAQEAWRTHIPLGGIAYGHIRGGDEPENPIGRGAGPER